MKSNFELVKYLRTKGVLVSENIIDAFTSIDRDNFLLDPHFGVSYIDAPLSIGYGQTISQPTTVAIMLELLQAQKGDKILDIGSGSGWTTGLLAHIVGPKGSVTGLEIISELVNFGQRNLGKYHFQNARIIRAEDEIGIPGSRFDGILASASAENFPSELLDQLKNNGRLVIPVQNSIWLYKKDKKGEISRQEYPGFVFVPLK